ncbi:hypothetical protein JNUCC74_06865 [Cerasibacillus sp. JNUCC 74]
MQATILLVEDDAEIARVIRDMFVRIWNQWNWMESIRLRFILNH